MPNIIFNRLLDRLFEIDGELYGGSINPSMITASRPTTKSSDSSDSSSGVPETKSASGLIAAAGALGSLASSAGIFKGRSKGEKSNDYLSMLLSQFIQNPERSYNTYNKNTDLSNPYFQNLINGMTGAGLTGAQIAQNQFNSDEAQKARDWQEYMSSTTFQRTTADMVSAGLNPAMMYGGSASPASTPASTPAGGAAGSGSGIGAIAELLTAASQMKLSRSTASLNLSQSLKNFAETDLLTKKSETESKRPAEIDAAIDNIKSETVRNIETAKSESDRRALMVSQSLLNNVNADNIEKMRPYISAELAARTEGHKSKAALDFVEYLTKERLLDFGVVSATINKYVAETEELRTRVSAEQANAKATELHNALKTGNSKAIYGDQGWLGNVARDIVFGVEKLCDMLGGIFHETYVTK